jgi:hypothetical protein
VVETLEAYEALYRDADPTCHRAIGDASTTYLHTPGALESVRDYNQAARIIVAVRHPVDMVRSMHGHNVFQQTEDVADFQEAWRLSDERREGRRMPRSSKTVDPFQHVYADMGKLGAQVARVMELFPRENVHIVFFDDLKDRPDEVYEGLLGFLGLNPFPKSSFEGKNVSKGHTLVTRLATAVPDPVIAALRKLGISNTGIVDGIVSRFGKIQPKKRLDPGFAAELTEFYRSDIELLSRQTGRDLSRWLDGPRS